MMYVECKPDFALVRFVTNIPKREIIHEFKGKYEVCKRLDEERNCKALIDEDPQSVQPPYVKKLRLGEESAEKGIKVMHDESNDNLLIILCPDLEGWILGAAKEIGVNIAKYNLPSSPAGLHRVINLDLGKFEQLLEDLKTSQRLKTLRRLIEKPTEKF